VRLEKMELKKDLEKNNIIKLYSINGKYGGVDFNYPINSTNIEDDFYSWVKYSCDNNSMIENSKVEIKGLP